MIFKKLKSSKKKTSIVGLGSWSLANEEYKKFFYNKISKKEISKILGKAYEMGINFYDTSPAYGKSENLIGKEFQKKKRENILICTKVGLNKFGEKINFKIKNISDQLDQSLRNLKTEYLDYVLIYNPKKNDKNLLNCYNFLYKQKKIGKIKHIGISLESPTDYLLFYKKFNFDLIQTNFNILDNRIYEKKLLNILKNSKIDVIARSIYCFGFFTEKFLSSKIRYSQKDYRSLWSDIQIASWKKGLKLIKDFNYKLDIENIAIRFVLTEKLISAALIGVRSVNELKENLKSSNLKKLNTDFFGHIKYINKHNNFFIKRKVEHKIK